jgi:hypothetical protein
MGEQKAVVDFACARLIAAGVVGQLDVADAARYF